MPDLSIITPAFNEAGNLRDLHARISSAVLSLGLSFEWVVVDDGSRDATYDTLRQLAIEDPSVRGIRLSRNFGSHAAIACGLHAASGRAAVLLAADLQDPPELLGPLVDAWGRGSQIVWAVRRRRDGSQGSHLGFARVYYWLMRRVAGLDMPPEGADCFLADRVVLEAFRTLREPPSSIFALLTWLGFRSSEVEYDKGTRARGASGWTLRKKLRLVLDSLVSFTRVPIHAVAAAGAMLIAGAIVAALAAAAAGAGAAVWLAALVLLLAGLQLGAIALVGQYVWRALDDARQRPAYVVAETTLDSTSFKTSSR